MLALPPGHIHLWLAYYDEIVDERLLASYRELLNDAERAQQVRFYFERDRHRYLVTRALVRTVLSRYAAIDPRLWAFSKNEYGRPEIAPELAQQAPLTFNISHTRGLIVLAVTERGALGVDVENIVARQASLDIARRFFAPEEVSALAGVDASDQHARFFEYWTFKESYIKARGMGLSIPLDHFSFHFPQNNAVAIRFGGELDDAADRWRFWQLRPSSQHVVALCAERFDSRAPILSMNKVVPLHTDTPLEALPLRTSE